MQSFCPPQLNCSDTSPLCPHCCHLLELTTTLSYYHKLLKENFEKLTQENNRLEKQLKETDEKFQEKCKEVAKLTEEKDQLFKDLDKVCSLNETNNKLIQEHESKLDYCSRYHIKQMKDTQQENDHLKENLRNYSLLLEKFETNIQQRDKDLNKIQQLEDECSAKTKQLESLNDQVNSFKKSITLDERQLIEKCEKLEEENRDLMIQMENFLKQDEQDEDLNRRKSLFDDTPSNKTTLPPFILPNGSSNTSQLPKLDLFDNIPGLKLDLLYDPITPALSLCLGGYKFNRNDDHMRDSFAMLYEWIKEQHRHLVVASLCKQLYKYFDENTQIPIRKFIENCSSTINLLTVLLINSLSLHLSRGKVADAYILHAPISKSKNQTSIDKQNVNHSAIKLMHEFSNLIRDKHNCEIKPKLKNEWLSDLIRNSFDDTNGTVKNSELVCEFRHPHTNELICYRLMLMSPTQSIFVSPTNIRLYK